MLALILVVTLLPCMIGAGLAAWEVGGYEGWGL